MAKPTLAAAAAVAVSLAFVACTVSRSRSLDTARGEGEIRRSLEQAYGTSVTAVNCPEREAKRGDRFQCTARVDGAPLRVDVTQTDDRGNIRFAPAQAVLDLQKAVAIIERTIAERTGVTAQVSCGRQRLLVSDPGGTFECEVSGLPEGEARLVVTVKDVEGNVDFRLA